jgi:gliding motility-associated-like protein
LYLANNLRIIRLILIVILAFPTLTKASHILGGEITYTHIVDLKYKVTAIIYRDCNGCKLMGAGGGESNVDCGKIDLFLATSDNSTCGRQNLTKLSIERKKIVELLPKCASAKSKCVSNSNLSFGVEAHYFEVEINFENYNSYKGCSFDIYTNISWRTKGISTIDDDQPFYNFARLNPWIAHNSPTLKSEISPIVFCNQPVFYSHAGNDTDRDSLSFHMVPALSDYNKNVSYKAGYNITNPLDVYCPEVPCVNNPTAFPPTGFSFNSKTGDIVFTPVNCGQTALLVLEVKKWRKINGKAELVSIVRRDLQYIVMNGSENSPPQFTKTFNTIEVCAGEEICFDIDLIDNAFVYPDNSKGPNDDVKLAWDNGISGATFEQNATNQTGKFKGRFCWKTKSSDANINPYFFTVYANDGACPLNAVSSKTYQIVVKPSPKVELVQKKLECGYIEISSKTEDNLVQSFWKIGLAGDPTSESIDNKSSFVFKANKPGKYRVFYQGKDQNNCNAILEDSFTVSNVDLKGFSISTIGNTIVCDKDSLKLKVSVNNNYSITQTSWYKGVTEIHKGSELLVNADLNNHNGILKIIVNAKLNDRVCVDSVNINVLINSLPTITGSNTIERCYANESLGTIFNTTPLNGIWSSTINGLIKTDYTLDNSIIGNRNSDKNFTLTYTITDSKTGCKADKQFILSLLSLPLLKTEEASLCKGVGNFYIDNLILEPVLKSQQNLKWQSENNQINTTIDPINGRLFLDPLLYADGEYSFYVQNKGLNGCISYDTTKLTLLNVLKISYNGKDTFCGGTELDLINTLKISPRGGGWYSSTNSEWFNGGKLSANACGPISLNYTYDKFGCYDQLSLNVFAECMNDIQFVNRFDTVCDNYAAVNLIATPNGGFWRGPGIANNIFTPIGLTTGKHQLSYEIHGIVCKKNADYPVWVIESPQITDFGIKEVICQGQTWDLNLLNYNAKEAYYKIDSEAPIHLTNNERIESIIPNPQQVAKGGVMLQLLARNDGLCQPIKLDFEVKISQKANINFELPVNGCVPFKYKISPNYSVTNSGVKSYNWTIIDKKVVTSTLAEPTHTFSETGSYGVNLKLVNNDNCVFDYNFENFINVNPTPEAAFNTIPDYFVSVLDPSFQFINESKTQGKSTYNWNFGTNNINHKSSLSNPKFVYPSDTGKFMVSLLVTNEFGCSATAFKYLNVGPDIKIYIPNAFTPDLKGPEQNATFNIIVFNQKAFEIVIINRWGEVVYKSSDINQGWDGTLGGNNCLPGVYVYQIKVTSKTGKTYDYSGTVNLIR